MSLNETEEDLYGGSSETQYGESDYYKDLESREVILSGDKAGLDDYQPNEEEEEGLCQAFTLLDLNGDGVIGFQILDSLLVSLGRLPFDEEIQTLLCYAKDKGIENSVGIGFQGFKKYVYRQLNNTSNEEELRKAFQVFDSSPPSGTINLKELRFNLKTKGAKLTDDEIDFLFRERDFWMVENNENYPYEDLINKLLNKPECSSTFLHCGT